MLTLYQSTQGEIVRTPSSGSLPFYPCNLRSVVMLSNAPVDPGDARLESPTGSEGSTDAARN